MQTYPNEALSVNGKCGAPIEFRQPPHNIEAEQALLGAILVNNEAMDRVAGFLEPQHFYDPIHQQIYEVAGKLIQAGKQATPITLRTFFENAEPIDDDLTVPQYLGRLAANATTIINAADYGRTIYDLAIRRALITIGEDLVNTAYDSPVDFPPEQQIEEAESRLYAISKSSPNEREIVPVGQALEEAAKKTNCAHQRGDGLAGLATGIKALDAKLGGLAPGNLIILAGRPAMGKTGLATVIAVNIARVQKRPVGFVSLEMAADELGSRILSDATGVPAYRMRTGEVNEAQISQIVRSAAELRDLPLFIDQSGGLTLAQLALKARRLKRKHKIELLIIDYLQLMGGSVYRGHNRVQEITEITTGLKSLAKELSVPVLALSQLSREVEKREDKRPQLSDLRESGSIEQDADVVMFVYREEYYLQKRCPDAANDAEYQRWLNQLDAARGKAEVIIGKHRHGPTGTALLRFNAETMTFSSPGEGDAP